MRRRVQPGEGAHRLTRKLLASLSVSVDAARSLQHNDGTQPPKAVSEADRKFFFDAMAAVSVDPVKRMRSITAEVASNPQASLNDEDLDARVALFGAFPAVGVMQPCPRRTRRWSKDQTSSRTLSHPFVCFLHTQRGAARPRGGPRRRL